LPGPDARPGIFGPKTLEELPRIAEELGLTRVLLVTGRSSFAASGAADILPALRRVAEVETWSDFSPNPDVDEVIEGTRHVQTFRPDGIVAIGGGSVLDIAKLLAVFADKTPDEISAAVRANQVTGRSPALILVPTTSGSGSEATHFAVVYIGQEKFSVAHQSLLPDRVIVDPDLTASASPYQKATSVIDAIAQAVESHWSRGASETSRTFAQASLTDLVSSAAPFVQGDGPATVLAARGSYQAGRAIDLSKTTGAHAMAYGLTKRHGVSHGHAVATTLGAFARLHAASASSTGADVDLQGNLESIAGLIGADGAPQVGDRLDEIAGQLGLELRLKALGVPRSDLAAMAGAVNRERLANNPVEATESELLELLEGCW
jgi:alcohol dehydrogenase class IV